MLTLKVRDDWGKTPLHELAWKRSSNSLTAKVTGSSTAVSTVNVARRFDSVKLVLQHAPELFLVSDKRGFQAMQYVPRDAWDDWCTFLKKNKVLIRYQIQFLAYSQAKQNLEKCLATAHKVLLEAQRLQLS